MNSFNSTTKTISYLLLTESECKTAKKNKNINKTIKICYNYYNYYNYCKYYNYYITNIRYQYF